MVIGMSEVQFGLWSYSWVIVKIGQLQYKSLIS